MIKDIVLDYCEVSAEYSLLTVDAFDLDEMVEKIKRALLDEIQKAPHTWEDAIDVIREF